MSPWTVTKLRTSVTAFMYHSNSFVIFEAQSVSIAILNGYAPITSQSQGFSIRFFVHQEHFV